MANERGPILATSLLGNKIRYIDKKLWPVRPKTALGRKGAEKKTRAITQNQNQVEENKLFSNVN